MDNTCWTCGGMTFLNCICGGSGLHSDEVTNLRNRCITLSDLMDEIKSLSSKWLGGKYSGSGRIIMYTAPECAADLRKLMDEKHV